MEARGEVLMGEKSHRERLIGPIIILHSPSYPGGGISALLDSGDLAKYIPGRVGPSHSRLHNGAVTQTGRGQ